MTGMFKTFLPFRLGVHLILVSSIFALQILSLIQTDQPRFFCGPVITRFNIFNLTFLCDSSHYMLTADDPKKLLYFSIDPLSYGSPLQDRPLAPILAYLLSRVLNLFTPLDVKFFYSGLDNISNSYSLTVYVSYLVLNSIILYVTVLVALKLVRSKLFGMKLLILAFLSFNQLTQNYFWLPNTVLMNNLFAVLLVLYIKCDKGLNSRQHHIFTASFAILALYYPIFLFGLVLFFLINIHLRQLKFALISILGLLLTLAIPIFIMNSIGTYRNNPVNAGYFAWTNNSQSPKLIVDEIIASLLSLYNSFSILQLVICFLLMFSKNLSWKFKLVALIYLAYLFAIGVYDYRYNTGFVSFIMIAYLSNTVVGVNKRNNALLIFVTLIYLLIAFMGVGKTY